MKTMLIHTAFFILLAFLMMALDLTEAQEMKAGFLLMYLYIATFFLLLPAMAGDTEQPAEKE